METTTTFGHENEPELQKMAPFLRERCDKGKYGLQYLNAERTHIRIPWPTVPRANEEVHESFKMFTEWAILSFRKRGNKSDHLQNEALSAQKHRFRNALGRADGLRHCKEMSTDSIRVYEFVDTKKEKDSHDHRHERRVNRNTSPLQEYPDSNSTIEYYDWEQMNTTAVTMVTTAAPNSAYTQAMIQSRADDPQNQFESVMYQIDDGGEQVTSLSTLLEEMMNTPAPDATLNNQGYSNDYSQYPIIADQRIQNNENGPIPQHQNYDQASNHLALPPQYPSPATNPTQAMNGYHPQQQNYHVIIKVMYRGEVVMRKPVTNSVGFRIYFGNNVPDMSRLLDSQQRNQLAQLTRFQCEELYGPDSFEQVEMPSAPITNHANQLQRTSQVLHNMDRGLVFYLEHGSSTSIPSIYSIRLCQTRVFPYESNVEGRQKLQNEGLKRMEWAKVFDAHEFLNKLETWRNFSGTVPSAAIKMSVGQKPKMDENNNLVSISIIVSKAQAMVDSYMEDIPEEICISSKNSMDVAAQVIQSRIQSSFRLEDENPMDRY